MKIGIIPDRAGEESYSEKWQEFIKKAGHQVEIIPLDANNLNRLRSLDGIMWRFKHLPDEKRLYHILSNYAEKILKIPIFPDSPTAWHYDEKIAQHFLFAGSPFPFIEGFLFFSYGEAMEWIASHPDYPLVHKLSSGAGAANVSLIRNRAEAEEMARRMFQEGVYPYSFNEFSNAKNLRRRIGNAWTYFKRRTPPLDPHFYQIEKNYLYFQRFLPGNSFDTRITVIGDRAFGFRRFNRRNDFRASGSGRIDYTKAHIDLRCVKIAFQVSRHFNFKSMAYDFLFNAKGEPEICEISYTYLDRYVYNCPGHWNGALAWIEGHMWPEEAQVQDFINLLQTR